MQSLKGLGYRAGHSLLVAAVLLAAAATNAAAGTGECPPDAVTISASGTALPSPASDSPASGPFAFTRASGEPGCLVITEIIDGVLSGSCPRFLELTNTGLSDFTFGEGGIIIQMDGSTDVVIDVDLTGVTIHAGQSFVINSTEMGACSGAFQVLYGFEPDLDAYALFGDGDDRYILTDSADGSSLLDIYGEFGVAGGEWTYEDGYSYRLPPYNCGSGGDFEADEWFFGGKDSLEGADPEQILLASTSPGTHVYDEPCGGLGDLDGDGDTDLDDYTVIYVCLAGPEVTTPPDGCTDGRFDRADQDRDDDVDVADVAGFQNAFAAD